MEQEIVAMQFAKRMADEIERNRIRNEWKKSELRCRWLGSHIVKNKYDKLQERNAIRLKIKITKPIEGRQNKKICRQNSEK